MNPILTCQHVTVRYEPTAPAIIKDISLDIGRSERVALLGLNGSGKTTLLYACVGLIPFDGAITVGDIPLSEKTAGTIRNDVGFLFSVPDDQILFPSVIDDIAFTLERRGLPRAEARLRSRPLMERLGIAHLASDSPHRLSHGQLQRVALAGALVADPPLLLLDEPSLALDPLGQEELAVLLTALNAAMFIATHHVDFVRRVCGRFIVLDDGEIVEDTVDFERVAGYWCHRTVKNPPVKDG